MQKRKKPNKIIGDPEWNRTANPLICRQIPIITGKYKPKTDQSNTPFYHRFAKVVTK
jgi:hypothetical protein